MATAELAMCLPVLVLVLAVALSAVTVAGARVRVQDAAREAARAVARGDPATAGVLAQRAMRSVRIRTATAGDLTTVTATARVHPIASWLPPVTLTERATAALESEVHP